MLTGGTRFKRNIADEVTCVNVMVFREGAIETISPVYLEYDNAAPQAKWRAFLIKVCEALKLQAIDGIFTEVAHT
jgi:hypothetical protein